MADKKLPLEVSVRGIAAYAWLYKKDTKFAKGDDEGKYKLTLVVDKDEIEDLTAGLEGGKEKITGVEWIEHIREMHDQAGGASEPQNCPVKDGDKQLDKKGKPKKQPNEEFVGKYMIDMKSGYQPQLVDTKKNDLPDNVKIYSGDVIKAVYRPFAYDGGVSLRLNAVMLIEKRNSGGAAGAFGDDEEGFVAPSSEEKAALNKATDDNDGDY